MIICNLCTYFLYKSEYIYIMTPVIEGGYGTCSTSDDSDPPSDIDSIRR